MDDGSSCCACVTAEVDLRLVPQDLGDLAWTMEGGVSNLDKSSLSTAEVSSSSCQRTLLGGGVGVAGCAVASVAERVLPKPSACQGSRLFLR